MLSLAHLRSPRRLVGGALLVTASLALAACGSSSSATTSATATPSPVPSSYAPTTVTLLTHDSFALTEKLLAEFTARSGITVKVVSAGDAGEVVNKAALTAGNPEGDVLFGVDSTLLSRALTAQVFDPYVSPSAAQVDPALRASTSDAVTPIDYGDVCVNIDTRWFADKGIAPPTTLADLADPRYKDLLVVQNAATSSPGLAFLLATVARYGEEGYLDYWKSLRANGVKVVNGWTEAYEGEFSAGGKGTRPLVVSYASSPPAEIVYAADPKPTTPTTAVMTDGCFRQVEYAGVLRGTTQPQAARAVVDWLLSPEVQADVPLSMFVFPARTGTPLPDVFEKFAARPAEPLTLDPARIDAQRSTWIDAWDQVTLR
ncbi:MAG: thiamine ABC transporter substrate-binding protein [Candidatus Nanopelagicales bacterium]